MQEKYAKFRFYKWVQSPQQKSSHLSEKNGLHQRHIRGNAHDTHTFTTTSMISEVMEKLLYITSVLTMGLSGNRGSVITKFFSIRSNVVAKSIPLRISLARSLSSILSGLSSMVCGASSSRSKSSMSTTSASGCCDFGFLCVDGEELIRQIQGSTSRAQFLSNVQYT